MHTYQKISQVKYKFKIGEEVIFTHLNEKNDKKYSMMFDKRGIIYETRAGDDPTVRGKPHEWETKLLPMYRIQDKHGGKWCVYEYQVRKLNSNSQNLSKGTARRILDI